MKRSTLNLAVAAAVLLLAGCATPGPEVPLEEPQELPATHPPIPVEHDWWAAYHDPALNALVDEALRHNTDLARAMARIDEARAVLGLARSAGGPVVSAGVSGDRQRFSENGRIPLGNLSPWQNNFVATLDVSYEIDLWGRLAAATAAARSELLASEYARETIRIALAAQVVQSYASLRALDEQIVVYQRAVSAQREGLRLNRERFDAGDMSELDWRQLEAELLANETQLPRLARARGETERSLALMLGRSPRAVLESGVARATTEVPPLVAGGVPSGLPSDLLQRRPDVRRAEAALLAAGARVDVARAAYLPSITLTASAGRQSAELSDLLDGPSTIFSLIASSHAADLERRRAGLAARRGHRARPPGRARLPRRRGRLLQGAARRAVRPRGGPGHAALHRAARTLAHAGIRAHRRALRGRRVEPARRHRGRARRAHGAGPARRCPARARVGPGRRVPRARRRLHGGNVRGPGDTKTRQLSHSEEAR